MLLSFSLLWLFAVWNKYTNKRTLKPTLIKENCWKPISSTVQTMEEIFREFTSSKLDLPVDDVIQLNKVTGHSLTIF